MRRFLMAVSAVFALSFVGSSDVSAQHHGCNSGFGRSFRGGYNSGYGYGGGYGYSHGYSSPRLSLSVGYGNIGVYQSRNFGNFRFSGHNGHSDFGGNHGFGGNRTWHDTSHLHYHAPSAVRHHGHIDYIPGHYDVHRTGHWNRHGR